MSVARPSPDLDPRDLLCRRCLDAGRRYTHWRAGGWLIDVTAERVECIPLKGGDLDAGAIWVCDARGHRVQPGSRLADALGMVMARRRTES